MANIRPVETLLLVLILAFTAANIGTEARYMMKRLQVCDELKKDDCDTAKGTYLFGSFRNLTMKFFCDCINLFFVLVSFISVIFLKKQLAPKVSRILFLIILTLTLMSLATGIRSIDEEDKYNEKNFNEDYNALCTAQQAYDQKVADYNKMKIAYESVPQAQMVAILTPIAQGDYRTYFQSKGYIQFYTENPTKAPNPDQLKQAKGVVLVVEGKEGLPIYKQKLDEAYPKVVYANDSCPIVGGFKDIYERYRNSVAALVIINFVLAYSIFLHSVFRWNSEDDRVKIITGSNLKLQEYKSTDVLKVPQTDVEMNAQNAM